MKNQLLISLLTLYSVLFLSVLFVFISNQLGIDINSIFVWILIVSMIGVVIYLIVSQINPNKIEGKLISSKLTPLYKFIVPLTSFLAFVFYTSLYLLRLIPSFEQTVIIAFDLFCLTFLIASFFPSSPFAWYCKLYLCEDKLVIDDYFKCTEIKYRDIVNLECSLFKTYRIEVVIDNKKKSYYFISTIFEGILIFYISPNIKKIHEIIKRNK